MIRKLSLSGWIVALTFILSGCFEVLSIPSVSVQYEGQQIAFLVQTHAGQSMALQILNLEDGNVQRIGTAENMQAAFDWHPSEPVIAFVEITLDDSSSIEVVDLSVEPAQSTLIMLPPDVWVNQLAYSPDGTLIALSVSNLPQGVSPHQVLDFSNDVAGTEAWIMLLDTATSEVLEITRTSAADTPSLEWNSSGTRLAYAYDGSVFVYDMETEESFLVNWTDNTTLRSPSWLNATTLLMVSAPDSSQGSTAPHEIISFDVTTSQTHSWSATSGTVAVTASPNGEYIAYIEGRPSSEPSASNQGYATTISTVTLLPVEQSFGQPIYTGVSLDRPVWSADSQTLYISNGNAFSMFVGNRRQIFAVDVASGAATPLFEGSLATSSLLGWFPPQEATPTPTP